MTVFHIPSWYPSNSHPYAGIFIKEFIERYAANFSDSTHIVSNQSENNYEIFLKPRKAAVSFRAATGFVRKRRIAGTHAGNVAVYCTPKTLVYSSKLGFDFLRKYTAHHRKNLEKALASLGSISLIHAHVTYPAGIIARNLSKEFGIPFLITEHLGPFAPDIAGSQVIEALEEADMVISVSRSHAKQLGKYISRPVEVIPNLVREDFFFPLSGAIAPTNVPHFLCIASVFDESKGIPQLLRAIQGITARNIPVTVTIGGSDKYKAATTRYASELGIGEQVVFTGKLTREGVRDLMQRCNAFVLPSQGESFGVVYAEAIACGKPVIATDCGGPRDIINDINGMLIPVDDAPALENALVEMGKRYHLYEPSLIRDDFLARFSSKAVSMQYQQAYKAVLEKNKN